MWPILDPMIIVGTPFKELQIKFITNEKTEQWNMLVKNCQLLQSSILTDRILTQKSKFIRSFADSIVHIHAILIFTLAHFRYAHFQNRYIQNISSFMSTIFLSFSCNNSWNSWKCNHSEPQLFLKRFSSEHAPLKKFNNVSRLCTFYGWAITNKNSEFWSFPVVDSLG